MASSLPENGPELSPVAELTAAPAMAPEAFADPAVVSLWVPPSGAAGTLKELLPVPTLLRTPAERELQLARQVQQSLLPKAFPSVPGFGIAGFCRTAGQVGGDFFDVFRAGPERGVVVIADVMGKGVPVALFAAIVRSMSRMVVETTTVPAEMLSRINTSIGDELSAVDMFVTAQIAVIDSAQQLLTIASAGHCPVLLADHQRRVRSIAPNGLPLGVSEDAHYLQQAVPLTNVSCAVFYSDGITEAPNATGEPFGQEGLEQWLETADLKAGVNLLHHNLASRIRSFSAGPHPRDDQTFVLLAQSPKVVLQP